MAAPSAESCGVEPARRESDSRRELDHADHVTCTLHTEEVVEPAHDRAVGNERRNSASLVAGDFIPLSEPVI
jgi:hypothetical protein